MILSGKFPVNSRLPSERAIAKILKSSQGTVTKATSLLEADGLIKKRHGSGNYILQSALSADVCFFIEKLNDKLNPVWFQAYESFYLAAASSPLETHAMIVPLNENEFITDFAKLPDVIIAGLAMEPDRVKKILDFGRPVVWLEQHSSELPGTSIYFDNFAAGEAAARHLIEQGCRKLLYFTSMFNGRNYYPSTLRFDGFRHGASKYGGPDCIVSSYALNSDSDKMISELGEVLRTTEGVFAFSDVYSTYVVRAALSTGIKIPDELAVIGLDGLPLCELFNPPLSTISQHPELLGAKAFDAVMEILAGRVKDDKIVLPPELIIRESSRRSNVAEKQKAG